MNGKINRQPRPRSNRRRIQLHRGWTLVELLVALATGTIVLAALVATTTFVSKSLIALGNYSDLNRASRNALDIMSRDVRNAAGLVSYATNSITLTNLDGTQFSYTYNSSTSQLTRSNNIGTTVLLTDCKDLYFYTYQKNPTNNFQFTAATTPGQTKLINVSWRCSRSILGAIINSESVQTAEIVIRN